MSISRMSVSLGETEIRERPSLGVLRHSANVRFAGQADISISFLFYTAYSAANTSLDLSPH